MFILCKRHEDQNCPGDCPAKILREKIGRSRGGHAYISPSSFHRYLRCPAAPIRELMVRKRMEYLCAKAESRRGKDDPTLKALVDDVLGRVPQEATRDGIQAHSLLEFALKHHRFIRFEGDWEFRLLKESECEFSEDFEESPQLFENLAAIVKEQVEILRRPETLLFSSETQIPLEGLNTWGTMDILHIEGKTLCISDLKTGRQHVGAFENEQLMGYACGVLDVLGWESFDKVVFTILGLRWKGSSWEVHPKEVLRWKEEVLVPAIEACHDYEPKVRIGSHCLYCRAKLNCREWMSQMVFREKDGYFSGSGMEDLDDQALVDRFLWSKEVEKFQALAKDEIALRFEGFGFSQGETRVQYIRPTPIKKWGDEKKVVEFIKKTCKNSDELLKEVPRISPDELEVKLGEQNVQGVVTTVGRRPYVKMS